MDTERDMHYCTVTYKEMWAELFGSISGRRIWNIAVTCNASI